jgi:hypothetical protein
MVFGQLALNSNVTGANIMSIGLNSLLNYTGSGNVVAIGANAARYIADGATSFVGASALNSIYIGSSVRAYDNTDSNAIVIGHTAIGTGTNTTVIGTASTISATLFGAGTHSLTDATTNSAVTVGTLTKNVTGAGIGAAGLGPRLVFAAESSTTNDTPQADITATWTDATHATRKTRLALSATDSAGNREGLRIEADGTQARIGAYGVAAVARPAPITTQLTTITSTAPGTPDYAIQDLVSGGFGFVNANEAQTVLSVLKNLQDRVAQMETALKNEGWLS